MAFLPNMNKETLATMMEMLHTGELCDLCIKGNDSQQVHKIHALVLASVSPEFHKHCDRSADVNEVPFSDNLLREVINLAYEGNCKIDEQFLEEAVEVGVDYQVDVLKEKCQDLLLKSINPFNMMDYWRISKKLYGVSSASSGILEYVAKNANHIEKINIQEMSEQDLRSLLGHLCLNMSREEALILLNDWHDRNRETTESVCMQLKNLASMPVKRRIPKNTVVSIGGYEQEPSGIIEHFNPLTKAWKVNSNLRIPHLPDIAYHGLEVVEDCLYVLGGYTSSEGGRFLDCLFKYDPRESAEWKCMTPMIYNRCYISTTVYESQIYAFGGRASGDVPGRLKTAEVYDPETNKWTEIQPMKHERSDCASVVLDGCIYVIGGFDGENYLSSIEKYDPSTGSWSIVGYMKTARSGVSAVCVEDRVFIIGGYDGEERLSSVECFSLGTVNLHCTLHPLCGALQWHPVPSMIDRRSNFSACLYDEDKILVMGGFKEELTDGYHPVRGITNNVEIFDSKEMSWMSAPKLKVPRSALASVNYDNGYMKLR